MKMWEGTDMWGMTLTNENIMRDETKRITHFGESPIQFFFFQNFGLPVSSVKNFAINP